jgi:hypothetical protein
VTGGQIGLLVAILFAVGGTYEALALRTRLPTISRVWQGLRDSSPVAAYSLGGLAMVVGLGLGVFAVWVVNHLIRQKRSNL